MPRLKKVVQSPDTGQAMPGLLIVAREEVALFQSLKRAFGRKGGIPVLFDRRQADRRRDGQPVARDRRRGDRRGPPVIADDLRLRRYVLARPRYRRPHD